MLTPSLSSTRLNRTVVAAKVGKLLLVFLGVPAVGSLLWVVWLILHVYGVLRPEALAVWQTADLVIAYMEKHDGAWPRSWEDLRGVANGAIDDLPELVEVDWSADVRQLVEAPRRIGEPPFRVIRLRSGRGHSIEGREPNQMIKDYLDRRYAKKEKHKYRQAVVTLAKTETIPPTSGQVI
jgi:hypothetical protein